MPRQRAIPTLALLGSVTLSPMMALAGDTKWASVEFNRALWSANADVTLRLEFSFDGGATWPDHVEARYAGNVHELRAGGTTNLAGLGRNVRGMAGGHVRLRVTIHRGLCPSLLGTLREDERTQNPTYDNASSAVSTSSLTLSWSHTTGSGSNRAIAISSVSNGWEGFPSSITYAGNATTMRVQQHPTFTNDLDVTVHTQFAPTTGSNTAAITYTVTAKDWIIGSAVSVEDADQTTVATAGAGGFGGGSPPTVDLTTVAGDFAIETTFVDGTFDSLGADQTVRWSQDSGTGNNRARGSTEVATGTTTTLSHGVTGGHWAIAAIAFKAAATGHDVAVGQVEETDTAQAITWAPKIRQVGLVSEADAAQTITRRKSGTIGQIGETDQAQSVTWAPKHRLVGQVSETDAAQAVTPRRTYALGMVAELDAAHGLTIAKTVHVGQVLEIDTALGITPPIIAVADFTVGVRVDSTNIYVTTLDDLSQFIEGRVYVWYTK